MQTEQELLQEIARVAGLINRKKQEQVQPPKPAAIRAHPPATRSYSKTVTQQPPNAAAPKVGKNMTYVRPGTQPLPSNQNAKTNPPTNAPKIQENISTANTTSKNDIKSNNPNQVTPILKYSKVITPAPRPSKYQIMMQNIRKARMRQMKAQITRRAPSMSLVIKDGVAYKKSGNKLTRVDDKDTSSNNNNVQLATTKKPSWRRNSLKGLLNIGDTSYKTTRTKLVRVVDKGTAKRKYSSLTNAAIVPLANEDKKQVLKNALKSPLKSPARRRLSLGGNDYASKRTSLRLLRPKRKSKQLCLFYTKFGKCNQGDKCPFVHDPEKVATCRNFLKGKCNDPNCLLRHKIDRDQMPVCYHFLKGNCTNENCPYSHVKVNRNAEVCPDFLKGYCPRGSSCKLKHTDICEEFLETGKCKNGDKCKLRHVKKKKRKADEISNDEQDVYYVADSDEEAEINNKEKAEERPLKRIRPNFE